MYDPNTIREQVSAYVWLILVFTFLWSFWPLILLAVLSRVRHQLRILQNQLARLQEPQHQNADREPR